MRLAIALVVVLVFSTICPAQATWYVPDDSPTIQRAIDGASHGDTVIVRAGTYSENISLGIKAITLKSEAGSDVTVIDGNQNGSVVICVNTGAHKSTLDGFTITNGSGTLDGQCLHGGGIYNTGGASPIVINCVLTKNTANSGAGMYNTYQSNPIVKNCAFIANIANGFTVPYSNGGSGGGMYNYHGSSPVVESCIFSDNQAFEGGFYDASGGGIYSDSTASLTLIDCTFSNNTCQGYGGGTCGGSKTTTVTGCTFKVNTAYSGGGMVGYGGMTITNCVFVGNKAHLEHIVESRGGGIYNFNTSANSRLTIVGCTFLNNEAYWDGGGMYNGGGKPFISQCTFRDNFASDFGGGMSNDDGASPTVTSCLFLNNKAGQGGGIHNDESADAMITNCTFNGNNANKGGGMFSDKDSFPKVTNCIFWGDLPNEIKNADDSDTTVHYSCVMGGYPGRGNIDVAPMFLSAEDLHLTRHSPCINRGTNEGELIEDIDGDPRPNMGTVDMGADEFTGTHTLSAYSFSLSQSAGGVIPFFLQAGPSHAGQWYCLFSTLSGTSPGLPLPGGKATLPINTDVFTSFALGRLNTPYFFNFLSVLNAGGMGSAVLDIPAGALPLGGVGYKMHFAYTIDSLDMASNPLMVEITP